MRVVERAYSRGNSWIAKPNIENSLQRFESSLKTLLLATHAPANLEKSY